MSPFSIYIHIPYCFHKCPYCDFNTYAVSTIPEKEYMAAVIAELDFRTTLPEWQNRLVQTIYFGGGTPSLLQPGLIAKVLTFICRSFRVSDTVEITLEANPGSVTAEQLREFGEAGINRLSFGAQSFRSRTLKILGRIHTADQTEACVEAAREAGFTNLNLDLMYGVPEQTLDDVIFDLEEVVRIDPPHLSVYGLTIEKGTPYYQQYASRKLILPKEDTVIAMMDEINMYLQVNGYKRYEISNYAREGKQARHNLVYWNGGDYLGLGAGAHSFCREGAAVENGRSVPQRWANFALPNKYMEEAVAHGNAASWTETLTQADQLFEFFFLGLRKIEGVRLSEFEARFQQSLQTVYPALIDVLTHEQLLEINGDSLRLTARGLMVADSVIENFSDPDFGSARIMNA